MSKVLYGYIRISTPKQNIDRQITNLRKNYPTITKIYIDKCTGRNMARPEWNKLMKIIKEGDCIVFDEVSRMSRNAEEGFDTYKELFEKGITLIFLKEPHINTDSYKKAMKGALNVSVDSGDTATDSLVQDILNAINKFMYIKLEQDIYDAFAEAQREVDYLSQRTKEGMREAKSKGRIAGRRAGATVVTKKSISSKKNILKYNRDFFGTLNDREVMKIIGISKTSYYKYKHDLKENYFNKDGTLKEDDESLNIEITNYASSLL
ncbi:MAG: recombinase family protein [Eubacterium sp.]